jgi:phytoene dehydrogenase-like protein
MNEAEVVIVGGGLAGLTAATMLARKGRRVALYEKAHAPGGRAMTESKHGFQFNLGPHALYRKGAAAATLRELGVEFSGRAPAPSGGYAVYRGERHTLPAGLLSLVTTGLLPLAGRLEAARWLSALPRVETETVRHLSVREWLDRNVRHETVRQLLAAFLRVATYANDPERQSAGAALRQFQLALAGNALYLDGGWQTLVDGLRSQAEAAGVRIVRGRRVVAVLHDRRVHGVRLANGAEVAASTAVLATSPAEAAAMAEGATALKDWAGAAIPVRAACLDVALSTLPAPHATFALGVDEPLYFSVHSAAAKLGPAGGAMIHVAKYLGRDAAPDAPAIERELESLFDRIQPGWRGLVVERRFLPHITVAHALVEAGRERPGPAVPGVEGLFVAGDWVGPEGQLADAAVASARLAAELASQRMLAKAA